MPRQTTSARSAPRPSAPVDADGLSPMAMLQEVERGLRRSRLSRRARQALRLQGAKARWRMGCTEQALAEMQALGQEVSSQPPASQSVEVLVQLAGVQINLAGHFEAALETLAQAQALAKAQTNPRLQALVLCALAPLLRRMGRLEAAERVLREGLSLLQDSPPSSLSLSLSLNLGRVLIGQARWTEAQTLLRAIHLSVTAPETTAHEGLSPDQLRGRRRSAYRLLALACARGNKVPEALNLCEQALSEFTADEALHDWLSTWLVRAEAHWRAGDRHLAICQFEQLRHRAQAHGMQALLMEIEDVVALLHSQDATEPNAPTAAGPQPSSWVSPAELRQSLLRRELPLAVRQQQLEVWFQPIMNADGSSSHQVELLARWHHPQWGWIPPQEFIALAEQGPCIHELGHWALQSAAACLAQHSDRPDLVVAVNLSCRQLAQPRLVETFVAILQAHHIPPQRIVLELTESSPLGEDPRSLEQLIALRNAGFGLALDDFGSGFANFNLLDHGLFEQLKIDRSLVATPQHWVHRTAVLESIMSLARRLKLRVVAEGVEREDQWARMQACGVDHYQGYLFAEPMPAHALQSWMRAQTP